MRGAWICLLFALPTFAADSATVTLYNPWKDGTRLYRQHVELDGTPLVQLKSGERITFELPAGSHTLVTPRRKLSPEVRKEISVEAGRSYFLHLETRQTSVLRAQVFFINDFDEREGKQNADLIKPVSAKRVANCAVVIEPKCP